MQFTISTLTVTTTRFSGVLGAMWAHFSSLRVIVNIHLDTGLGLEVLNIIISLGTVRQGIPKEPGRDYSSLTAIRTC